VAGHRRRQGHRPEVDAARGEPADHRRLPLPLRVEILPAHVPLPAKIRTEPIEVDDDPERADDEAYVQKIHGQVEAEIEAGLDRLAAKRTLPVLGLTPRRGTPVRAV
jgi:hypothetical protein